MKYTVSLECRDSGAIGIFWDGPSVIVEASSTLDAVSRARDEYEARGLETRFPKTVEVVPNDPTH